MSAPTTQSVIHDIGYKPYTGPRHGRRQIFRALYVHGLRALFGLGRGPRAKIVPWFVVLIMVIPAALNVYMSSAGKALVMPYSLMGYRMFLFAVLFVAVGAPELVSRDLRHHTLPLYFSRPLRRADYPAAKLLALCSALLMVTILPVLITFVGQVASAKSGHEMWLDTRLAFPGVLVAVLQSAIFSALGLLLASTTGRRVIATGVIAIFFLVTLAISHVFEDALGTRYQHASLSCVVPTGDPKAAQNDNGPGNFYGVGATDDSQPNFAVTQLCPGIDLNNDNFDGVHGQLDASRSGYADITVDYEYPVYNAIAKAGGLISPVDLVEGTRVWVTNATDNRIPLPGSFGAAYAAECAAVVLLASGGLFLRYRKVSVS